MKLTNQQRQNIAEARKMMATIPPENIYPGLRWWRNEPYGDAPPTCGTVACFGGWCAWWPAFRAQGIDANGSGMPCIVGSDDIDVDRLLFGSDDMFVARRLHPADAGFKGTDHELILHRLDWVEAHSS